LLVEAEEAEEACHFASVAVAACHVVVEAAVPLLLAVVDLRTHWNHLELVVVNSRILQPMRALEEDRDSPLRLMRTEEGQTLEVLEDPFQELPADQSYRYYRMVVEMFRVWLAPALRAARHDLVVAGLRCYRQSEAEQLGYRGWMVALPFHVIAEGVACPFRVVVAAEAYPYRVAAAAEAFPFRVAAEEGAFPFRVVVVAALPFHGFAAVEAFPFLAVDEGVVYSFLHELVAAVPSLLRHPTGWTIRWHSPVWSTACRTWRSTDCRTSACLRIVHKLHKLCVVMCTSLERRTVFNHKPKEPSLHMRVALSDNVEFWWNKIRIGIIFT
jgi:hypothetical protein